MSAKRKIISVDESIYKSLKEQGQAGDSFNHVIKSLLDKIKPGEKLITDQDQELR
jgi:predicted CopG family antitoxin